MKNILLTILIASLLVVFSACKSSGGEVAPPSSEALQSSTNSAESEIESQSVSSESSEASAAKSQNAFEIFASGLDNIGIEYEEVVIGAELVGAVQGMKYRTNEGNIELYMFDESSDALKKATENNAITLEGFGAFPAEINGKYTLLVEEISNKDDVIALFKKLN